MSSIQSNGCTDKNIFHNLAESWWSDYGFFAILRYMSTNWSIPYYQRVFTQHWKDFRRKHLLDVGCGGGVLAEHFSAMGFTVTGIDPAEKAIGVARTHAVQNSFPIDYHIGYGDKLPFKDETFDIVVCNGVLEVIKDWNSVIREIARVLVHQGIFMFYTTNRTTSSKEMLEVSQENAATRFIPPNTLAWEMFITPAELTTSLEQYGLHLREIRGTKPVEDPAPGFIAMQQHNQGKISSIELAKSLGFAEGPVIEVLYMGYALKP